MHRVLRVALGCLVFFGCFFGLGSIPGCAGTGAHHLTPDEPGLDASHAP